MTEDRNSQKLQAEAANPNSHPADQTWTRMRFKKNKVWAATESDGKPILQNGKVLIKYQLNQEHEYWIHEKSLKPLENGSAQRQNTSAKPLGQKTPRTPKTRPQIDPAETDFDEKTIRIYTDGASSGNPGPAGIGVVLQYSEHRKEISKYIGSATNNIAELEAIRCALLAVKNKDLPVRLFTDSSYAQGVLILNWKAKKNPELVAVIKKILAAFKDLKIIKVKGHAGDEGNELADHLATSAIKSAANRFK